MENGEEEKERRREERKNGKKKTYYYYYVIVEILIKTNKINLFSYGKSKTKNLNKHTRTDFIPIRN